MKIKLVALIFLTLIGYTANAAKEAYGSATLVGEYPNQTIECRGLNDICWVLSADGCKVTVYFSHGAVVYDVVEVESSQTNEPVAIEDIPKQCNGGDYIIKVLPIEE